MANKLIYILTVTLLGMCLTVPVLANEFQSVTQLVNDNKLDEAYQLLTQQEVEHIGEIRYDLLLARIALKSGRPHEAIFAYERVLINKPGNSLARVELAIAYYQINELEKSRQLLNIALKSRPPEKIESNIHQYILRINEKIGSRRHSLSGIVTVKEGWDSNINSATNESEIELTVGTYQPTEGVDKQTADAFTEVINRLQYNYNANVNVNFFSHINYTNKQNNSKPFDTQTADVSLGYSHATGIGKFSIPVSYQTMWLDNRQLREVSTVSTRLNRSSSGSFTNYSLQYGEIRYPDQTALNVNFVAATLAFGFSNKASMLSQQYALFYGDETATDSLYEFNARQYWGAQIRMPVLISNRHRITPKIVYQFAEYNQQNWLFKEKRQDRYTNIELNWQWLFDRSWSLTSQIGHTRSNSSVPLYTYTKTVIYTGITYSY